jgi:hypothetical protein
VSGTVGLGNIAGVAVAITIGGPGATFWMILAGLLGMSTKFVECTLGVKYRLEKPDGTISGGPMYYLSARHRRELPQAQGLRLEARHHLRGLRDARRDRRGRMFQANQAYAQLLAVTGGADGPLAATRLAVRHSIRRARGHGRARRHHAHRQRHRQAGARHGRALPARLPVVIGLNLGQLPAAFGAISTARSPARACRAA